MTNPIFPAVGADGKIQGKHLPEDPLAIRVDNTVGKRIFAGEHMIYGDTGLVREDRLSTVLDYSIGAPALNGVYFRRINQDVHIWGGGNLLIDTKDVTEFFGLTLGYPDQHYSSVLGRYKTTGVGGHVGDIGVAGHRHKLTTSDTCREGNRLVFYARYTTSREWLPSLDIFS